MLCLSRYPNETIVIGDNIRITVLGNKGGQVRLGIEAPRGVTVNREEVHNRIKAAEPLPE
jgi:carbon storage regulator